MIDDWFLQYKISDLCVFNEKKLEIIGWKLLIINDEWWITSYEFNSYTFTLSHSTTLTSSYSKTLQPNNSNPQTPELSYSQTLSLTKSRRQIQKSKTEFVYLED